VAQASACAVGAAWDKNPQARVCDKTQNAVSPKADNARAATNSHRVRAHTAFFPFSADSGYGSGEYTAGTRRVSSNRSRRLPASCRIFFAARRTFAKLPAKLRRYKTSRGLPLTSFLISV
jgi:hypothetical protein